MMKQTDRHGNPKSKFQNALEALIKWFSVIGLVVAIGVMTVLYFGPELQLNTSIVIGLAIPSVILAFSISIVYTMWLSNGQQSASKDEEYKKLVATFLEKSENLHYPTLQDFLDYEEKRRYEVEKDRLDRLIDRETVLVEKMQQHIDKDKTYRAKLGRFKRLFTKKGSLDKLRVKWTNKRIKKWTKMRDTIRIRLPYDKSEEFDYLRYSSQNSTPKEHSPRDTARHLRKAKAKKYANTFVFTLVGFNILGMGATYQSTWAAVVMTLLAIVTLVLAVVQGFMTGYRNISVISTGVYNTAVSYLDQGVAYCDREGKNLYYKGINQFREIKVDPEDELPRLDGSEFIVIDQKVEENIFTKAALEVTKTNHFGI